MKKILLLSVALCTIITKCRANNAIDVNNTYNEHSTSTSKTTIIMTGNPTTGYEWKCETEDSIIAIESKYESDSSDKTLSGAGGTYTFTLIGHKEGNTTMVCKYKRDWEETESDEIVTYQIIVDKDLTVSAEEIVPN